MVGKLMSLAHAVFLPTLLPRRVHVLKQTHWVSAATDFILPLASHKRELLNKMHDEIWGSHGGKHKDYAFLDDVMPCSRQVRHQPIRGACCSFRPWRWKTKFLPNVGAYGSCCTESHPRILYLITDNILHLFYCSKVYTAWLIIQLAPRSKKRFTQNCYYTWNSHFLSANSSFPRLGNLHTSLKMTTDTNRAPLNPNKKILIKIRTSFKYRYTSKVFY
jgi:hypothetical protein